MAEVAALVSLVGYALGTIGGVLLFVEFFQLPNYVEYEADWDSWRIQVSPTEVRQYSAAGRVGTVLIAVAFALQFVAGLL